MLEFFFVYKYNASYLFYYQNKVLLIISTLNLSFTIEEGSETRKLYFKKFHCKIISNFGPNVSGLRGKYHNLILYQCIPQQTIYFDHSRKLHNQFLLWNQ